MWPKTVGHSWSISHICKKKNYPPLTLTLHHQLSLSYARSNMQGCTKCILLLILSFSFLFVYLFYNTDIFKFTMTQTINRINDKMIRGNRKSSNETELNNKRIHTSDGKEDMLNNIAKVKNYVTLSKSEPSQVKVLLLAYGRTGSSLTGDLISADTSSAYFFEPFW